MKAVTTYNDIEALREHGKHAQSIRDANTKGLSFQRQHNAVFGRSRPTKAGKRRNKSWPMPPLEHFLKQAEAKGVAHPRAQRCIEAENYLETVRAEARNHWLQVRHGSGPAPALEPEPARELTVAELIERYLEGPAQLMKPSTLKGVTTALRVRVLPAIGDKRLFAVERHDFEVLRNSMSDRPFQANRVLDYARGMFKYAQDQEWCAPNPVRGVPRFPEPKRERWLSTAELERLGEVLDRYADNPSAQAIKLIALTGARKGEVLGARWTEFEGLDGDDPKWTTPALRTKTSARTCQETGAGPGVTGRQPEAQDFQRV